MIIRIITNIAVRLDLVVVFIGICGSSQIRVDEGSEAASVEQGSGDVVMQVPEASGGAAEVLDEAVDRLCGAVARVRVVEEREHVVSAPLQRPAERAQFLQPGRDPAVDRVDERLHDLFALGGVGGLVGVD